VKQFFSSIAITVLCWRARGFPVTKNTLRHIDYYICKIFARETDMIDSISGFRVSGSYDVLSPKGRSILLRTSAYGIYLMGFMSSDAVFNYIHFLFALNDKRG